MVISTHEALTQMARDFKAVKDAADNFVKWANEKLEDQDEEMDMEVEASLPQRRPKKKKKTCQERCPRMRHPVMHWKPMR